MIQFTVPGDPRGKQRPRMTKYGTAYTPRETVAYEKLVKACMFRSIENGTSGTTRYKTEPVCVTIIAYYRIPTSITKKVRERIEAGDEKPTKKPDADNIAKIIMDALNGLAYQDDRQVVALTVLKEYAKGTEPRVEVTVSKYENIRTE